MPGKTHRLSIGEITCIVVHDGPSTDGAPPPPTEPLDEVIRSRFPNATDDEINDVMANQSGVRGRPSSLNALYVESAGQRILVSNHV